uniref:Transforming, acidic coiled-coil containing protein 1 n=1 Tax=Neogobius melanostomus TaxID=47308 RepID=A0A8C6UAV5_9GOBI
MEEKVEEKVDSKPLETFQEASNSPKSTLDIDDIPIPKSGAYNFDPENFDESYNPFQSGGSKIPNSPTSKTIPEIKQEDSMAKPVMLEFGLDEGVATKAPPKKLGARKTISKGKIPKTKATEEKVEEKIDSKPLETFQETSNSPKSTLDIDDIPIPKSGAYNFDPENFDESYNPFESGGSKIPNSPTSKTIPEIKQEEDSTAKPVVLEFGLDEGVATKAPPKKLGARKTISKKIPKAKTAEEKSDTKADVKEDMSTPNADDVPLPKTGSYSFHSDVFDDSIDPFKPSKSLRDDEAATGEGQKPVEMKSQKKSQEQPDTSSCKVQPLEDSPGPDVAQEKEEEVVVRTPEITQREHHATDEEKLANTGIRSHTQPAERPEGNRSPEEGSEEEISTHNEDKAPCWTQEESDEFPMKPDKTPVLSLDPQSGLPLSEMDKATVLTLIREEIITKEMEVEQWKRKYEESRTEVQEMRKIVAEYEKTVAQMIEDGQMSISCSSSVRTLTMERDQALSDLSSVERSFSELFRRYESMKGVLEGFKKNEEVLKKCAQEYLLRIKQEEQRYQTLKVHAEEKLDKANAEIAQVRSKATAETLALGAGLRKEQMKAESLERAVQQKNQEIEELTKICDELIAKLGPA